VLINKYFKEWFAKIAEKTETKLDDVVANIIGNPTLLLLVILGLAIGNSFIIGRVHDLLAKLTTFLLFIGIGWVAVRLLDGLVKFYVIPFAGKSKTTIDEALILFVTKIIKIVIWVFLILLGVDNLGIRIDPILNILPNLLWILTLVIAASSIWIARSAVAGLFLIFTKTFKAGDKISHGPIEGTVVEVGVWGTIIKDAKGVNMLVPNHEFMSGSIALLKVLKEEPKKEPKASPQPKADDKPDAK
jgi:small-conductance mechanosensitive channel